MAQICLAVMAQQPPIILRRSTVSLFGQLFLAHMYVSVVECLIETEGQRV